MKNDSLNDSKFACTLNTPDALYTLNVKLTFSVLLYLTDTKVASRTTHFIITNLVIKGLVHK